MKIPVSETINALRDIFTVAEIRAIVCAVGYFIDTTSQSEISEEDKRKMIKPCGQAIAKFLMAIPEEDRSETTDILRKLGLEITSEPFHAAPSSSMVN